MIEPKRKPVDGTLPLTDEEKGTLKSMLKIPDDIIDSVEIFCDSIIVKHHTKLMSWRITEIRSLKAILWLAERFELEVQ